MKMGTNENKQGKNVVVEDGHPASFRNLDGSLKNIYADDGSLTEEGQKVMKAREDFAKEENESINTNKERKRKRKLIVWAVSVGVIVFFFLFFHIYISSRGEIDVFAKSVPTFSNTFINGHKVNDVLERYNNASLSERMSMQNETFVKLLFDKGILYHEDYSNTQEQSQLNSIQKNEEQTYHISVGDLYSAYENEASADSKYLGKNLIVKGKIVGINKSHDGTYYVKLSNGVANDYITIIECYFSVNNTSSLTSLKNGQIVSIAGKCNGKSFGFPTLINCSLEDNRQLKQELLNEKTENYRLYYHGEFSSTDMDWETLNVKITFGKKQIKVVSPELTRTYIIEGSPKLEYDKHNDTHYATYNVYDSEDTNKDIISIARYKNETTITYEPESCNYVTFKK